MTWQDAQAEAARRIRGLGFPAPPPVVPDAPAVRDLAGVTVVLLDFETDAVALLCGGGQSAAFHRIVNKAATRQLERRGVTIKIRKITARDVVRGAPPLAAVDGADQPLDQLDHQRGADDPRDNED